MFGIAGHLAELTADLKDPPGGEAFVESLSRYFGNVRAALDDPQAALLSPAVERFCQELDEAAEVRLDLADKCRNLQRQARRLSALVLDEAPEDDLPF